MYKQDLTLNNPQGLICHKMQLTNHQIWTKLQENGYTCSAPLSFIFEKFSAYLVLKELLHYIYNLHMGSSALMPSNIACGFQISGLVNCHGAVFLTDNAQLTLVCCTVKKT